MQTLSIVIPALDERSGVRETVDRVLAVGPEIVDDGFTEIEVIVVDDGSTDGTPEIVEAIDGVRLIRHDRNRGYGAALKTGFAAATGDWIGFLDADGTYPAERFPELLRAGIEQDADIVVGSRRSGADSRMPAIRRLGNHIWSTLLTALGHSRVMDPASGMRVFRRSVIPSVSPLPDGLNLTPVMSTRALHEDLRVLEIPIPYDDRVGESKLHPLRDGAEFTRSILWTSLGYNPSRILGFVGVAMMAAAAAISVAVIAQRLQGVTSLGPMGAWTTFLAVLLGVAGVSVAVLGIGFNFFVALFHKQPVRQGLLLGRPILGRAHVHLGWLGAGALVLGCVVSIAALVMGLRGWPLSRLWFYYLFATAAALVGIQALIGWVQCRVLEALSIRDDLVGSELDSDRDRSRAAPEKLRPRTETR